MLIEDISRTFKRVNIQFRNFLTFPKYQKQEFYVFDVTAGSRHVRNVRNYCKEFIKAQVSDRVVLSTMTNSYIETIKAGYIEADDDI